MQRPVEGVEISARTFWAGPAGSEYTDSTTQQKRKVTAPDGVVALPLPEGQRPFPVTSGEWYLRVVAYRATKKGTADAAFILVCDQVLDENDRYLYLAYVDGDKTKGVVRPTGGGERYFRVRPAASTLTFKLIPAWPVTETPTAPTFQLAVELSQRQGRPRYF